MLTRRHFMCSSAALFSAPLTGPAFAASTDKSKWDDWDAQVTPAGFQLETSNPWGLHRRLMPQRVARNPALTVGDIHVDAKARYLYHIEEGGTAMRYGVAIARDELYTPGTYRLGRKAKWPTWTPTANMIKREPETYAQHASGMDAGPENPLGSRALYLYRGSRDTYLRIHGS
ncbi:MAG: L,D-transpeptidase, partial [Pseudomonadota bacterium]